MANGQSPSVTPVSADKLARAFLSILAQGELSNAVPISILAQLQDPENISHSRTIRADMAMAAVLTAKLIADQPGLLDELVERSPAIIIATRDVDLVHLVKEIIDRCVIEGRPGGSQGVLMIARDGSQKSHVPDNGNDEVLDGLHNGAAIIGITSAMGRVLPAVLQHAATHRLTLPQIDEWAMGLVISAATGDVPTRLPTPEILRRLAIKDLPMFVRSNRTPDECVDAILTQDSRLLLNLKGPKLEELHGLGAAKRWGLTTASDLRAFAAGQLAWADVDGRGLLLSGAPGTGKTTFAAALARSAGVNFVATSVADWNSAPHLGGTLQAIKASFAKARKSAPSVMLIDEADGISRRDNIRGDHIEYWTQIVNLVLEELSSGNEGVVFLAATNYPERIDPAIKRAGRLDREIVLEPPDPDELEKIFRFHLRDDLVETDLQGVAMLAFGATGAQVEAWVKRAAAEARRGQRKITLVDLIAQVTEGATILTPELRHRIAVHESGHLLVGQLLRCGVLVGGTIHSTGGSTQFRFSFNTASTLAEIQSYLTLLMAGRAAEQLVFGSITAGSGVGTDSDLAKATNLATSIETEYGLGTLGTVHLGPTRLADIATNPRLLEAVMMHLDLAHKTATTLIDAHRAQFDALVSELDRVGYLSADDVARLVAQEANP